MKNRSTIAACLPILVTLVLVTPPALAQEAKTLPWYIAHAPFPMTAPVMPAIPAGVFNIKDHGAIADGKTLNTSAIQQTIQACAASGGGHVVIPEGQWLTGPITLQSNIDLHLEKGAMVQFTRDRSQYPMMQAPGSGSVFVASPVYGFNLQNVSITGEGIMDGGGDSWRPVKKGKATPG